MATIECGLFNALKNLNTNDDADTDNEERADNNLESECSEDSNDEEQFLTKFIPKATENGIELKEAVRELADTVNRFETGLNVEPNLDYEFSDDDFELPFIASSSCVLRAEKEADNIINANFSCKRQKLSKETHKKPELSCAEEKEFYATCGRKWSIEPETSHIKRSRSNILRTNPDGELTASSRSVETILDAWQLFFSDDVLEKFILKYSNEHRQNRIETRNLKIEAALQKHIPIDCSCRETIKCKCNCHKKKAEFEPITLNMLKAFIGLLYMKGACKSRNEHIKYLWTSNSCQRPFFSGVMSRTAFFDILTDLRFDDKKNRQERLFDDNMAAIRDLWTYFNDQLIKHFVPSADLTIDEQLILFRGRCKFKIYNKSKPGRYGFLIRWLCDAGNRYALYGLPYCSIPPNPVIAQKVKESNTAYNTVLQFAELPGIKKSGRNITTDRFYTSIQLADELYEKYDLTTVGTIMANRKHLPRKFLETCDIDYPSSQFCFSPPVTLVSYRPKPKKNVLLISTMHNDAKVSVNERNMSKPDIVFYYNDTKAGVDTMDQMCRYYGTKVASRRWPLVFFYNMLDIAGINAFTIFNRKYCYSKQNKTTRYDFLRILSLSLVADYVTERRRSCLQVQKSVSMSMNAVIEDLKTNGLYQNTPDMDQMESVPLASNKAPDNNKRGICPKCMEQLADSSLKGDVRRRSRNKAYTCHRCTYCKKFICTKHSNIACNDCYPKM